MGFRYTAPSFRQHLLLGSVLVGAFGLGSTHVAARGWALLVESLSDPVLFVGGLMVVHTALYWPVCLAFDIVDRTDRPGWIARHRIQNGSPRRPPLGRTLRLLCLNQFFLLPVLLGVFYVGLRARGWTAEAELPTAGRLALELAVQGLVAPIVFYGAHRFLHRTWWMRRVHRVHHEFHTTSAWASEYAHPVEFVIGNFGALVAGAWLILPHLASMYLFATLSLLTILVHHSGYALPWAPWSVPHDWHHHRVAEMFGTTGFLDRLFGTDRAFREHSEAPPDPGS